MKVVAINKLPLNIETLVPSMEIVLHISQEEIMDSTARNDFQKKFMDAAADYRNNGGRVPDLTIGKSTEAPEPTPEKIPQVYLAEGKGFIVLSQILAVKLSNGTHIEIVYQVGEESQKFTLSFMGEADARIEFRKLTKLVQDYRNNMA